MHTLNLRDLLKDLRDASKAKCFMSHEQLEQIYDKMSGGDMKARRVLDHFTMYLGARGVFGEMHVAILAALYSTGFHGNAIVQAFESNDFSFDETCNRAIFSLIRSPFPWIEDPKNKAAAGKVSDEEGIPS